MVPLATILEVCCTGHVRPFMIAENGTQRPDLTPIWLITYDFHLLPLAELVLTDCGVQRVIKQQKILVSWWSRPSWFVKLKNASNLINRLLSKYASHVQHATNSARITAVSPRKFGNPFFVIPSKGRKPKPVRLVLLIQMLLCQNNIKYGRKWTLACARWFLYPYRNLSPECSTNPNGREAWTQNHLSGWYNVTWDRVSRDLCFLSLSSKFQVPT